MAMTPEAKVKKKVVEQLKNLGAYYFYPVTGGYGASGVPDIVGCFEGRFFGISFVRSKSMPLTQTIDVSPLSAANLLCSRR